MEAYDVVVIGAGNGGLAAAATTAKMGLKTLLLERHNIPGGSATSFRRGRFEFEPSLHELAGYGSEEAPGDVRAIFDSLGARVDMLPVEDAFRSIVTGPGGYDVTMPTGIPAFVGKMEQLAPGSAASVTNFFKLAGDVGQALGYLGKGKPDPAVLAAEHVNFMKVAAKPVGVVLDELGMPQRAQEILMTYWPYMGTPRGEFAFPLYALMVYRYISMKAYIPKGRSHEMSMALEESLRNLGGEVWYNTEVARVLVRDGRCTGVVTADGREIVAKQVVADISPHRVFGGMVDEAEIPEGELKRANARKLGFSGFCVYLGLDKSPEELGIKDYSVFISGTADSDAQQRRMYSLDDNDFLIMNCLNIDNPGCSPQGTSLLWATQLYGQGTWDNVKPEDYKAVKNRIAKKVIGIYEAATGIRIHDCIEEIAIATPVTFARYLNTPEGSIYGYHGQLWDSMLPRTMAMNDEYYIKGLRFCGGYSTRLLGYSSTYVNGQMMGGLAALDIKEGR